MKNKFITGVIIGGMVFGTVGAFAGQYVATENPFPIQLNGKNVSIKGYNIEGSTYFKLRDIADVMGGFDVGFNNNTIQLAKEGYSYSNTTENDVVYYKEKTWCPDFGAFTGAVLKTSSVGESGTIYYTYDMNTMKIDNHTKYYDLILATTDLKLNPASDSSFILFENLDTGHNISCMLKNTGEFIVAVK